MSTELDRSSQTWGRTVLGLLLVLFGIHILLEQISGEELDFLPLAAGVVLLAHWARRRRYWALVAGALMAGWGVGEIIGGMADADWFRNFFGNLSLAGGFLLIYRLSPRSTWALGPAAVLGFLAIVSPFFGLVLPRAEAVLPFLVIVAGGLLVARGAMPPGIWTGSMAVVCVLLAITAIASVADEIPDWDRPRLLHGHPRDSFDLDGRHLVVETSSGDVAVDVVRGGRRLELRGDYDLSRTSETVTVRASSDDVGVRVPSGARVSIRTSSGDVGVEIGRRIDAALDIETSSGEIDVDDEDVDDDDRSFESDGDDGSLTIRTSSGDVEVDR